MLIISNFKDYYDRILDKTGIDKKVIFYRKNLRETEFKQKLNFDVEPDYRRHTGPRCAYRALSICGKRYFIKTNDDYPGSFTYFPRWSDFHLITKKDLEDDESFVTIAGFVDDGWWYNDKSEGVINFSGRRRIKRSEGTPRIKKKDKDKEERIDYIFNNLHGILDNGLIEIHKKLGVPIFAITGSGRLNQVHLHDQSPVLKDIKGIQALLDPLQLFNDISFFIANTLTNCNPEIVQISNNDKIVKAGFDLKTSFRNM